MKAWYIVVVVLIKGHREIKEPLSSSKVPGTLIGPGGVLRWLKSEGMQFYSVAEWGTQSRWDCTQRAVVVLCGRWRLAFRKPGACDYRTWFLKGQSATGEDWDAKRPHAALWFLDVSQFNLLPFGFHLPKCIHWMTQSVILDLLIFYRDIVECEPNIVDTWDLWPVINLVK